MALKERSNRIDLPRRIFTCAVVILLSTLSHAGTTEVYWSGYAYQGDMSAAAGRYPFSVELSKQKDGDEFELEKRLRKKMKELQNDSFNVVLKKGSIGPDAPSSIALAFVLDGETVSVEKIGGKYKVLIELSAQALFFDFKEMAVVSTYPLSAGEILVRDSEPTHEEKAAWIDQMYKGSTRASVFDRFVKTLAKAKLNTSVSRRIQVTDVSVDEAVFENLPEFWQENQEDFGAYLSQQFGRHLSKNQNVPVLPYTQGYAVGYKMSGSFEEGEVYELRLPEPDYAISLSLDKLVKLEYAKVAAGTSYIYGSYLTVNAEEPLSKTSYLDKTTIKNGEVKKVPATQTHVDDWPAYQDSILGLFDKFTKEISAPSKDWVAKHIGDASARKQLSGFGKVVLSCR